MQTTSAAPIQMNVASNGARVRGNVMEKYLGFILSLLSAMLIGCFSFMWKVNGAMVRWEERDMEKTNSIDRVEQKLNTVQLDVSDLKITTTRIETKQQNFKPQ